MTDWLSEQLAPMEAALAALVNVNSFTDNPAGGREVGALLQRMFAIDGLVCEVVPSTRFADHLVFRSDGVGAPIGLVGHLDTVFPPGVFEGYKVDGALRRGPGVLDMKGGLVVMAWALKALAVQGELLSVPPLRVIIVADEEVGSPESQSIIRRELAAAQACLVFESGRANDAIVTSRKGTGSITARATGRAAHTGNNHADGVNAIWAVARFVDRVQALTDYARGITVSVGKISGGTSKNTVPAKAECALDIRFVSASDAEWLMEAIRRVAAEAESSLPGSRVVIEGGVERLPMERTAATQSLLDAYAACARAQGLGASESPRVGGGSDACTSSAMGIASLDALGPRGQGFHTLDEYIEIDTLIPRARALQQFLRRANTV